MPTTQLSSAVSSGAANYNSSIVNYHARGINLHHKCL